mmetsp:Transcript_95424/g.160301  ORF Transcript_95424/g.160301 Transcript_95424/m.160301 type:complete len:103 (+) Transcript_95424:77-385(+)
MSMRMCKSSPEDPHVELMETTDAQRPVPERKCKWMGWRCNGMGRPLHLRTVGRGQEVPAGTEVATGVNPEDSGPGYNEEVVEKQRAEHIALDVASTFLQSLF